jgi:hypothetical protein
MGKVLTPTDLADIDQLLAVRPRHQTSRMSWPVDEDTTRRLRLVIAMPTDGDAGLRWWRQIANRLRPRPK